MQILLAHQERWHVMHPERDGSGMGEELRLPVDNAWSGIQQFLLILMAVRI